jgi:protein tyrosine phosphatase
MSPSNGDHIKRIVGTLNERGQFRSLISLASTPSRQSYEGMLRDLYKMLDIKKKADQKHAEAFYSIRRSKISAPYNRYRDIYAFDRTAVRVPNDLKKWIGTGKTNGAAGRDIGDVEELSDEDSGYLNANVISDGKGSWWVACQVCLPFAFVSTRAHPIYRHPYQPHFIPF